MGVSVTLEWLGLSYLLVGLLHRSTITVMLEYYQRDLVLDQERHLDRLLAVFGESLDELANRQRARIWLPLVGSHSGAIVS